MDADKNRQVQSPANDTAASLSSPAALTKNDKGIYTSSPESYTPPAVKHTGGENSASRTQANDGQASQLTQVETRKPAPQVAVESINSTTSTQGQASATVTGHDFGQIEAVKQENNGQEKPENNRSVLTNQQSD